MKVRALRNQKQSTLLPETQILGTGDPWEAVKRTSPFFAVFIFNLIRLLISQAAPLYTLLFILFAVVLKQHVVLQIQTLPRPFHLPGVPLLFVLLTFRFAFWEVTCDGIKFVFHIIPQQNILHVLDVLSVNLNRLFFQIQRFLLFFGGQNQHFVSLELFLHFHFHFFLDALPQITNDVIAGMLASHFNRFLEEIWVKFDSAVVLDDGSNPSLMVVHCD